MKRLALLALLVAALASSPARAGVTVTIQNAAAFANDATVTMQVRFTENGVDLNSAPLVPTAIPGPFPAGAPKTIDISGANLLGSGRTICVKVKNVKVPQTTPIPTPDSPEVGPCVPFPAGLQSPAAVNVAVTVP